MRNGKCKSAGSGVNKFGGINIAGFSIGWLKICLPIFFCCATVRERRSPTGGLRKHGTQHFMTKKPLSAIELDGFVAGLKKLARNIWWCWDQEAQDVFQELSPRAWTNLFHNAAAVLREISDYELRMRL